MSEDLEVDERATLKDVEHDFRHDFLTLPEVPSPLTMMVLARCGGNMDFWGIGKSVQAEHEGVPWKTEYEIAVGRWTVIRQAMLDFAEQVKAEQEARR